MTQLAVFCALSNLFFRCRSAEELLIVELESAHEKFDVQTLVSALFFVRDGFENSRIAEPPE